jgi:[ribosomal protein S18]-alanine N-acetyltransferase
MIAGPFGFLARLFARGAPAVSDATLRDAAALSELHAHSFRRGWSETEFEQLLTEGTTLAHRAMQGRSLAGFIVSRIVMGEAEILTVAVDRGFRGRGIAGALLRHHLGRLAGLGVGTVFLEVDEANAAARALYARAGFREVARRTGYYPQENGAAANALVLRRDLV